MREFAIVSTVANFIVSATTKTIIEMKFHWTLVFYMNKNKNIKLLILFWTKIRNFRCWWWWRMMNLYATILMVYFHNWLNEYCKSIFFFFLLVFVKKCRWIFFLFFFFLIEIVLNILWDEKTKKKKKLFRRTKYQIKKIATMFNIWMFLLKQTEKPLKCIFHGKNTIFFFFSRVIFFYFFFFSLHCYTYISENH